MRPVTARSLRHAEKVRGLLQGAEERMTARGFIRCGGCGLWRDTAANACRKCWLDAATFGGRRGRHGRSHTLRHFYGIEGRGRLMNVDERRAMRTVRGGSLLATLGALATLRMFRGSKRGA